MRVLVAAQPYVGHLRIARAVGQGQYLVVQRVVEAAGQGVGGEPDRGHQIGPAHIADEQRVAGQHPHGSGSSRCSQTTTDTDSGVWPGGWRISSTTSPSSIRCSCASGSVGNSASASVP